MSFIWSSIRITNIDQNDEARKRTWSIRGPATRLSVHILPVIVNQMVWLPQHSRLIKTWQCKKNVTVTNKLMISTKPRVPARSTSKTKRRILPLSKRISHLKKARQIYGLVTLICSLKLPKTRCFRHVKPSYRQSFHESSVKIAVILLMNILQCQEPHYRLIVHQTFMQDLTSPNTTFCHIISLLSVTRNRRYDICPRILLQVAIAVPHED